MARVPGSIGKVRSGQGMGGEGRGLDGLLRAPVSFWVMESSGTRWQ